MAGSRPTLAKALLLVPLFLAGTSVGCGRSQDQTATGSTTTAAAFSTTSAGTTGPTGTTGPPAGTTSPSTAGPGTSTTSTPPDDDGGIDPLDGASTSPQNGTGTGTGIALLESVRVARHEGFDRVVFQFRGHVPAYQVRYQDKPVRSDGPGEVVPLEGNFALVARMEPASGVDLSGGGPSGYEETYTGPKRIDEGLPEITEVVETGDYEAVLTWAIGTVDRADFRVFTLAAPSRLVIDVRNH